MAEQWVRAEQLAQLFGVSVRRVQQLTQEGAFKSHDVPGEKGRMYDFLPTVQAYIAFLSDKAYGRTKKDAELELKNKKLEVEIALKESQGELHRLKTEIAAGKYASIEEVKLDYQRFFVVLKKFVTAIPSRVGIMVNGYVEPVVVRGIERDLSKEMTAMLQTFVCAAIVGEKKDAAEEN